MEVEIVIIGIWTQKAEEAIPEFDTGKGAADYVARRNIGDDIFLHTRANPYLVCELKGRDINLEEGSAQYRKAVKQLKLKYLLAPNCKSAKWGLLTNSSHIQLFRKHNKVIHPATPCLKITPDNIDAIIASIRQKIEKPMQALTVAIYNNKGGVGNRYRGSKSRGGGKRDVLKVEEGEMERGQFRLFV